MLRYANPRWGFALAYPSAFRLDPDSVPENGDTARFSTPDRSATAVVTALRNEPTEPLSGLLREAERDILENSRGTITYRRATRDWFVLSGHVGGRIYYRRSFLAREGRIIATLWIEFPRDMRPCFEEAVTVMSLSFRPDPG